MKVISILPESIIFRYEDVTTFGQPSVRLIVEALMCGTGILEDGRSTASCRILMTDQEFLAIVKLVDAASRRVLETEK